ncbi:MAG: hypothetical protein M3R00_09765, partial [Pseudomonadota bacterium]|nr:hypothetical protein [Pseudomonadota bacterium]
MESTLQEHDFAEIKAPGDNSCLFWSVALGYLTPVLEDAAAFQKRYQLIFGNIIDYKHIHSLLQKLHYYSDTSIHRDYIATRLICEQFRSHVIEYEADHQSELEHYFCAGDDHGSNFHEYLAYMHDVNSWGSEIEIRAMADLLGCNI